MTDADYGAEFAVLGDRMRWMAEDLQESGRRLQDAVDSAQAGSYRAASPDGGIEATADGRGRITGVRLAPGVRREDPDRLGELLTATLNDALRQARHGTQQAMLEALPGALRREVERTTDDTRPERQR